MKIKKLITAVMAAAMAVTSAAVPVLADTPETGVSVWDGTEVDTSWYAEDQKDESGAYVINSAAQFAGLAKLVNDNTSKFGGATVKLNVDIDLDQNDWTPIGSDETDTSFRGSFNGQGHTISNLWISTDDDYLGLFGYAGVSTVTEPAAYISNLTLKDPTVISSSPSNGNASYVGGVVANGRVITMENVHVIGNMTIQGYGYVGGILGHSSNATMRNCSVCGYGEINCHYWCGGGIAGYIGGGTVEDCSVIGMEMKDGLNIWSNSGGIAAVVGGNMPGSTVTRCSATNVGISSNRTNQVGAITGYSEGASNNAAKDVTITVAEEQTDPNDRANLVEPVAEIGGAVFASLPAAIAALQDGDTLTLLDDTTVDAQLVIDKGVTIDLGGNTITSNLMEKAGADSYVYAIKIVKSVSGNPVTIKNGTINHGITYEDGSLDGCQAVRAEGADVTIEDAKISGVYTSVGVTGGGKLTVTGDSEIIASKGTGIFVVGNEPNTELVVESGLIKGGWYGISGNGSNDGTNITINGGTVTANTDEVNQGMAIYHPQDGKLTITGGTITGWDGIQFCGAGEINISGGTIEAMGDFAEFTANTGSSSHELGAALSILSRSGGYGAADELKLNISGGTFKSAKGSAIYEKAAEDVTGTLLSLGEDGSLISGGEFISAEGMPAVDFQMEGVSEENKQIISGGEFTGSFDEIKEFVVDDAVPQDWTDGEFKIVSKDVIAGNVILSLVPGKPETEAVKLMEIDPNDPYTYAIVLTAEGEEAMQVNRYMAAELTLGGTGTYEILPCENAYVVDLGAGETEDTHKYALHMAGEVKGESGEGITTLTGHEITIGYVRITGYGPYAISVKNGKVQTALANDNIVDTYMTSAAGDKGMLKLQPADGEGTGSDVVAKGERKQEMKPVAINVMFPNTVNQAASEYTKMTVTVESALGDTQTFNLGDAAVIYDNDGEYAQYTMTAQMAVDTRYTITFKGKGYRTYSVDAIVGKADVDPSVNVWNNVMDNNRVVVDTEYNRAAAQDNVTFLAGDIDDSKHIDLYDLSAAVAYFGKAGMKNTDGTLVGGNDTYVQYDLNRDGAIDSKDIAMVLVSWNY